MPLPFSGVDHPLVGVHDLEAAREAWRRLGFTITPRGSHIGWGTANYCIMFPDDYIEIIGIVDAALFTNNLDRFLEVREGLLGFAFATRGADASRAALDELGIASEGPKDLARNLELPEGTVLPRFRLLYPAAGATPGVSTFICQHDTPELVRRPEWLEHANGACGLRGLSGFVDDQAAGVAAWRRFAGDDAVRETDDGLRVRLGQVELALLRPVAGGAARGGLADDAFPRPWLAGLALAVRDIGATARFLDESGTRYSAGPGGRIAVDAGQATGVALEFVPA